VRTENGKIEGDFLVQGELELNGMVTGTITVPSGASLHLHGICCADLVVMTGATAIVFGSVAGDLVNQGVVELRGVVNGNVATKGAHFQRSPSAVVHGSVET
jgi:cytoskeletal protein CcmA (bactofilin family)